VWRHAPPDYDCPFCRNIATGEGKYPVEILRRYDDVVVKMNPRWKPANPGAALVMPIEHLENAYELPDTLGNSLQRAVRETAIAMKVAYKCDGITTRQNNEPAGGQDVWHFHIHVVPRYDGDGFTAMGGAAVAPLEEFQRLSDELRAAWPGDSNASVVS
jgi:histidine triad (HIT) family protein